jgi:hypothetical protein
MGREITVIIIHTSLHAKYAATAYIAEAYFCMINTTDWSSQYFEMKL